MISPIGSYGTTIDRLCLTQVLSDGTNTYVYGYTRLAQVNDAETGYFLTDALGSVRQVTDLTGAITLVRDYSPYGETVQTLGGFQSDFSFTGEMTDAGGLVYLRARYYDPATGRFVSRDTWEGEYDQPGTQNRYVYVRGNPINSTDPTGHTEMCDGTNRAPCSDYPGAEIRVPPTPDPNADRPTQEPQKIVWSPSVSVMNLWFRYPNGELVPPGTIQSQFNVRDNNGVKLTGACGPLSAAAISKFYDPQSIIKQAYDAGLKANYLGAGGLVSVIQTIPGWNAYIDEDITDRNAPTKLRTALSKHHYPIPGVRINGSTGIVGKGLTGHWLVVTGLSIDYQWNRGKDWQWVRVFNPFNNQKEYYMWSLFNAAWGSGKDFSKKIMVVMCSEIPFSGIPNSTC